MSTLSLYKMSKNYEQAFLDLADMDVPEDAILDTLEAMEGELLVKIANVGAFIKNLEAEATKIKTAEKAISDRRNAYENKAERLKKYLKWNMEKAGFKNVSAPDGTFSITLLPPRASLVITNADVVPERFTSRRVVVDVDNAALKAAIERGEEITCAHLEYNSGLRIS